MSKLDIALEVAIHFITEGLVIFLISQYNYYLAAAYGLKFAYGWFTEIRSAQMDREIMEAFEAEEDGEVDEE